MSKETERLFREMQQFFNEHNFENLEEAQQAAMDYLNSNKNKINEPDAYDFLAWIIISSAIRQKNSNSSTNPV